MSGKTSPARRASRSAAGNTLQKKRTAAKAGMVGSIGALVLTGMRRAPGMRGLHVWAGVALLGFTYWHSRLYPTECRKDRA